MKKNLDRLKIEKLLGKKKKQQTLVVRSILENYTQQKRKTQV